MNHRLRRLTDENGKRSTGCTSPLASLVTQLVSGPTWTTRPKTNLVLVEDALRVLPLTVATIHAALPSESASIRSR
jgi:hypothetical protein